MHVFTEGHRERRRAAIVRHAYYSNCELFALPPSPAQQMLYQSRFALPDCQSNYNPSFFFSLRLVRQKHDVGMCGGLSRLTQTVNDNNNLMDGYILLHA